ncbi:MAG: RNB domain-containing ribonuclease [Myxococcales bacterium]|nr:RNB domain-containing ribonuclease [Myxococcales bacterium]
MFPENAIVFLDINGQLTPAVAVSADSNAVTVWLSDKQPQKIKLERVLRVSRTKVSGFASTPTKALTEANAYLKTVRDVVAELDLQALWELLVEEGGEYALDFLAGLATSQQGDLAADAMAICLLEDKVYFRAAKNGFSPNPVRSVEAKRIQQHAVSQQEQEESWAVALIGQLLLAPSTPAEFPEPLRKYIQLLRDHALAGPDHPKGAKAIALLEKIDGGHVDATWLRAFDILVRLGVFREHENLDLIRHRLVEEFPAPCLDEAVRLQAKFQSPVVWPSYRVDLRDVSFVAIDDADTRDVDDALTAHQLENGDICVSVAISDAAEFVEFHSALGTEARRRASSLYLPDRIIPMLPPLLSEHAVSLTPHREQAVLGFSFVVQEDGTTRDFAVVEAIANLRTRLTYDDVDAVLAEPGQSTYASALSLLENAALRLRRRRRRQGALLLRQPDFKIKVASDGKVLIQKLSPDLRSQVLVSEMMITTCALTAEYCRRVGIPTVYRWQDAPEEGVDISEDQQADPVAIHQMLRRMRRAELSLQARPHYGLGVPAYTQVTSPIRRYQDLVMHTQIKGYLRDGHSPLGEKEMLTVFAEVENVGSMYNRLEKDAKRYWTLHYLRDKIGEVVHLAVLRDVGKRFLVELVDYGIQETISPTRDIQVGSRIEAVIAESLPRRDRLILRT